MKTKLTTLLIMSALGIMSIHAELRHFLPTTNAYMSILDYKFWFEGDTIINSKEYIKVYRQFCHSETECDENKDYYAAVRQDTINEKIYCIQVDDGVERLIADFDVKAGDEIRFYSFWDGELSAKIQDVDEIMIDGHNRKRISIAYPYSYKSTDPYDFWIEGIGSTVFGLFFPFSLPAVDLCESPKFLCLHVNNELIYQNPKENACYKEWEYYIDGFHQCVIDCEELGGERNDCWFYCESLASTMDDKYTVFLRHVKDCTDEGGEFGDCLSRSIEEYRNTGIPDNAYKTFNISQSPTNDYLLVETELFPCSYMIYNNLGAVVKQGRVSSSDINISTLTQGVYYAVFYHNKESIYIHKFVK